MANTTFPNFTQAGVPAEAFPYANLLQQLFSTFNAMPTASYGRWNGTGVSQDLGFPSGINPGPTQGYPAPSSPLAINPNATATPQGAPQGAPPAPQGAPQGGFAGFGQNFGAIPAIPNVPGNTTPMAIPYGNNGLDRALAAFAAKNPNSGFAQYLNNRPQSFTPAQFNQVAATDPRLALTMIEQGGQNYENAVMQQNGWTQPQMNSWLNGTFYGPGDPHSGGLTPANLAKIRNLGLGH